eukprot:1076658-Rhodomonas_salina.1
MPARWAAALRCASASPGNLHPTARQHNAQPRADPAGSTFAEAAPDASTWSAVDAVTERLSRRGGGRGKSDRRSQRMESWTAARVAIQSAKVPGPTFCR